MRHSRPAHFALNALAAGVCSIFCSQVIAATDLCEELSAFGQGLKDGESREITLFTEWSAQPTRACRHGSDKAEKRFCDWFGNNAVIEFMEANVWNVVACITASANAQFSVGSTFAGQTRFTNVKFGRTVVDIDLEYSVLHRSDPDRLTIHVAKPTQ